MNKYSAEVNIVLRKEILDVQGKAIENSLHDMEFKQLFNIRVGKIITLNIKANSIEEAKTLVDNASKKLLANPIMEDYSIIIK
jgi:phosphoribosylformylglycinamidine synthase